MGYVLKRIRVQVPIASLFDANAIETAFSLLIGWLSRSGPIRTPNVINVLIVENNLALGTQYL